MKVQEDEEEYVWMI